MKQSKILGLGTIALAAVLMTACGGESPSGQTECDPACGENQECKEGKCVDKGSTPSTECDPACGENQECKEGKCVDKGNNPPANECNPACGENQECQNGTCVDKGNNPPANACDPECTDGKTCKDGSCVYICEEPTTVCDDGCKDLTSDNDNCGSCGNKCGDGKECKESKCIKVCDDAGQTACGDSCFNLMSDTANCGECGHACGGEEACLNGECKKSCVAGTELCGSACLNLDSNETCGTCDNNKACNTAAGEACVNRECKSACLENETFCGGACINLKADKNNCGECGHACNEGEKCNGGTCGQDCGDLVDCNGNCIDPKTSKEFCGANNSCAEFTVCGEGLSCQDGVCACAVEGESVCAVGESTICTNPKTSATYCGCNDRVAGVNCDALPGTASSECQDGTCKFECDATHANCDDDVSTGCEADLTSADNCGACGNKCEDPNAKSASCNAQGQCEFECNDNMKTCDGKCTDVLNDKNNCGFCGNKCEGGDEVSCQDGFCVVDSSACDLNDGYATVKVENANGDKVEIKAYCIYTKTQFEAFRNAVNNADSAKRKYPDNNNTNNAYILMAPIDLGAQNWAPIGIGDTSPFTNGYFLGNGQKISGTLTINNTVNTCGHSGGLFGDVVNSYFYGVNLDLSVSSTQSSENTGILVGRSRSSNTFIHNRVKGTLNSNINDVGLMIGDNQGALVAKRDVVSGTVKSGCRLGGLIGTTSGSTTIIDSEADVTVNVESRNCDYGAGGLIGYVTNTVSLQNISTKGNITDAARSSFRGAGGIIGYTSSATTLVNSTSSMKVDVANTTYGGGLVGYAADHKLQISNSSSSANVTCKTECGGLAGRAGRTDAANCATIVNSYASGSITSKSNGAGGAIGYFYCGTIQNSYATGKVTGANVNTGGFAGYIRNAQVQNIYATGDVSSTQGSERTGGLFGRMGDNNKIAMAYATGKVSGGTNVGGLVGYMDSGIELTYAAATGNVENATFMLSSGNTAGGLVGYMEGTNNTIINCMATGDVSGGNNLGSVVGEASGVALIRNTYGLGKLKGGSYVGGFVGKYTAGEGISLALRSSYYWEEIAADGLGAGSSVPNEASVFPFKFNDNKDAVLTYTQSRKLVDALGQDWVAITCNLPSGPKQELNIPVLKALANDICK